MIMLIYIQNNEGITNSGLSKKNFLKMQGTKTISQDFSLHELEVDTF